MIVSVAIPRPVDGLFTYRVPELLSDKLKPGCWVKVPFGRGATHAFIVEGVKQDSELPKGLSIDTLKEIQDLGSEEPVVPADVMELCRWAAQYYHAPLGELLNCAVPKAALGMKTARKEGRNLDRVLGLPPTLDEKKPLILSEEQAVLTAKIWSEKGEHRPVLLEGVTGSGKTEVYLDVARRVLETGQSVLILVPEIALTPQLHSRLEKGLGQRVGQWHSALSDGLRRDLSIALRSGELRALVGARSAVFAPIQNLGLIVVDEEHDSSYKQEDRVKYHARDIAVLRAKNARAISILGSATPSFESLERAQEGRYLHLKLEKRYSSRLLPEIEIVDLREEPREEGVQAVIATKTKKAIQETLNKGEQVIVFLNRRGFASFLLCEDCGWVEECPDCSISLTFHKRSHTSRCHLCGFKKPVPDQCDKCQGLNLKPVGAGTESLEEELPRLIPEMKSTRLDRDQVTSATRLEKILTEFREGKFNTLLGTQMLVKGHDFPGVTLVVVVLADSLLSWPDFRASERALQVLTQVAGRAGRGEVPGKVLIQTFQPEHTILQILQGKILTQDWIAEEREMRKVLHYPPFGRLAKIRFESPDSRQGFAQADASVKFLEKQGISDLEILGPSEALVERAKGQYRWDVVLRSQSVNALHRALNGVQVFCRQQKYSPIVDVDPYTLG